MTYESNCTRRLRPRLFGRGGGAVEDGAATAAGGDALEEEEEEVEVDALEATEWSDSVPSCSEPYPLSELVSMSCRSSFSTRRSTARWKSYLAPRFRTDLGGVGGSSAPAVTCG